MKTAPQARSQWQAWQEAPFLDQHLSAEARQQGYTVLYVHPHCRDAFFALEGLLAVYGRLAARRSCPALVQGLWHAWLTWTLRLAGFLRRVAAQQEGTCPPCPFSLEERP